THAHPVRNRRLIRDRRRRRLRGQILREDGRAGGNTHHDSECRNDDFCPALHELWLLGFHRKCSFDFQLFDRRDQKRRARLAPASSPIPLPPFIAATSKRKLARNAICGNEVVDAGQSKLHRALANPPPENAPEIPPYPGSLPPSRNSMV